MKKKDPRTLAEKNKRIGLMVIGAVLIMGCLAYASVPLYRLFCQVTGFGGTTQTSEAFPPQDEIIQRSITVRFIAQTAPDLLWDFKPEMRAIKTNLGEKALASFSAKNIGRKPVAGTAIFNVTPLKAGKYFHKVQCFCFDEQILQPRQRVSMPVLFYIDPKMADDPNMNDVKTITLSYTFFKTDSAELDKALEAFYNSGEGDE